MPTHGIDPIKEEEKNKQYNETEDVMNASNPSKTADNFADEYKAQEQALRKIMSTLESAGGYGNILKALKDLNQELHTLNTTDTDKQLSGEQVDGPTFGLYPEIDGPEREKLLNLYHNVGILCDQFLSSEKDPELAGAVNIIKEMNAHIRKDTAALMDYDPQKEATILPDLLNKARETVNTADLGSSENRLASVGGNLSSRITMDYTDSDGNHMEGLFTEKKVIEPEKVFPGVLDRLQQEFPQYENLFSTMYQNWVKEYTKNSKREQDPKSPLTMVAFAEAFHDSKSILPHFQAAVGGTPFEQLTGSREFSELKNRIMMEMDSFYRGYAFDIVTAKIDSGSRIDSRNTAMSRVAALLNVPKLLAHSEPMQIKFNGKIIEGTFMERAVGLDISHPSADISKFTNKSLKGAGLQTIADLQVVDFICGNVDRHSGNMVYQYDDDGNFLGVQGIDNDASFGDHASENGQHLMNSIESMGVISESMAKSVMALRPEVLRYQLMDLGLSEKQLAAAEKRLDILQKNIVKGLTHYADLSGKNEPGKMDEMFASYFDQTKEMSVTDRDAQYLCVLKDSDFKTLHAKDLAFTSKVKPGVRPKVNQFQRILESVGKVKNRTVQYHGETIDNSLKFAKYGSQNTYTIPENEADLMETFANRLKEATNKLHGTSPEYINLQTALKQYIDFCDKVGSEPLTEEQAKLRQGHLLMIKHYSTVYLAHKAGKPNPLDAAREKENIDPKDEKAMTKLLGKVVRSEGEENLDALVQEAKDQNGRSYARNRIECVEALCKSITPTIKSINKDMDHLRKEQQAQAKNRAADPNYTSRSQMERNRKKDAEIRKEQMDAVKKAKEIQSRTMGRN